MKLLKQQGVVEAEKIRPCVVRLHKVKAHKKIFDTYDSVFDTGLLLEDEIIPLAFPVSVFSHLKEFEKMIRGPFKKRPLSEAGNGTTMGSGSSISPSITNSAQRGGKIRTPSSKPRVKRETPPPTIAASRSRRSIKPNPRYASEDLVTPKMIRMGGAIPILRRSETPLQRQREMHQSESMDDFFNKDSEDDEPMDIMDDARDQPFIIDDSDTSDVEIVPLHVPTKRGRGRPKKNYGNSVSSTHSYTPTQKQAVNNISKSQSQLQQIRKNYINQMMDTDSSSPNSIEDNIDISDQIIRKKVMHQNYKSSNVDRPTQTMPTENKSVPVVRKSLNTVTGDNMSTEVSLNTTSLHELSPQERRRRILEKSLPKGITIKPAASPKMNITNKVDYQGPTPQKLIVARPTALNNNNTTFKAISDSLAEVIFEDSIVSSSNRKQSRSPTHKTVVSRAISSTKRRSASPAPPRTASPGHNKDKPEKSKSPSNKSPHNDPFSGGIGASALMDDTEMPTFTIVNIHDIIKKKGDPLVNQPSHTAQRDESPSPHTLNNNIMNNNNNEEEDDEEDDEEEEEELERKMQAREDFMRRRAGQLPSKTLVEKEDTIKKKVGRPRSAEIKKKPMKPPTILNHTLNKGRITRSPTIVPVISTEKPAPRILNSMVAKKTEPVKPLIANLDDSADESYQLSLDEQEETEEDDLSDYEPPTKQTKTKKLPPPPPPPPKAKESSSAVTNSQNAVKKPLPPKTPTEKTVIQRDGDKIIKKVTCFETWYVLNVEEEKPISHPRNQLEIPLVDLANQTHELPLPSENWTSKVTLYELSPTANLSNLTRYTGDLSEHNIQEEDRNKYQPSCVMFRRATMDQTKRLPYDRAVIFKNKTFFTNMEGKNVRLLGAPVTVTNLEDIEILLQLLHDLDLESQFVEQISTTQ